MADAFAGLSDVVAQYPLFFFNSLRVVVFNMHVAFEGTCLS